MPKPVSHSWFRPHAACGLGLALGGLSLPALAEQPAPPVATLAAQQAARQVAPTPAPQATTKSAATAAVPAARAASAAARRASLGDTRHPDPCRQNVRTDAQMPDWLEWVQENLGRSMCDSVMWFDHLLGDERYDDRINRTHGRLTLFGDWDQHDGFKLRPRLSLRADLPGLENRFNVFVGRGPTDEVIQGRDRGNATGLNRADDNDKSAVGVGMKLLRGAGRAIDLRAGVHGGGGRLDPFVQAQWRGDFEWSRRSLYVRPEITTFWRRSLDFGVTGRLELDRVLGPNQLMRWQGFATFAQATDQVPWQHSLSWLHDLGRQRALDYELLHEGIAHPDPGYLGYTLTARAIYRQPIWRPDVRLHSYLGARWARHDLGEKHKLGAVAGLALEVAYGSGR